MSLTTHRKQRRRADPDTLLTCCRPYPRSDTAFEGTHRSGEQLQRRTARCGHVSRRYSRNLHAVERDGCRLGPGNQTRCDAHRSRFEQTATNVAQELGLGDPLTARTYGGPDHQLDCAGDCSETLGLRSDSDAVCPAHS
eukprot:2342430-Rhodomonas_salina.1